jgi:mono/diheme cytochrome c family protein
MKKFLAAVLLLAGSHDLAAAQDGEHSQAIKLWTGAETQCRNCHGVKGEGGFGPDLAGRKLTAAQFTQAVRSPWGIMPAYINSQISDNELALLARYFEQMPAVAQPAKWRFEVPAGAAQGQVVALTSGCGQCHGPILNGPRSHLGAIDADFAWFKTMVYDHTTAIHEHEKLLQEPPPVRIRMGNYAPTRMWESQLRTIYDWARDIGFRPRIVGRLSKGVDGANGVTYALNVSNNGLPGKGLGIEDVTIALIVPEGASVVATTGDGYQGVRMDEKAKRNTAVWTVPRMAPKDKQSFTITLSRAGTAADNLRGSVRWTKPAVKTGPSDEANINPAPL